MDSTDGLEVSVTIGYHEFDGIKIKRTEDNQIQIILPDDDGVFCRGNGILEFVADYIADKVADKVLERMANRMGSRRDY